MARICKSLCALTAIAVGVACAPYRYYGVSTRPAGTPPTNRIEITLKKNEKGECVKEKAADGLYGVGGQQVIWAIKNTCDAAVKVQIRKVVEKGGGNGPYPFVQRTLIFDVPVGTTFTDFAADVKKTIMVPGHEGFHVYVYTIRIAGKDHDPEIIIEWPEA